MVGKIVIIDDDLRLSRYLADMLERKSLDVVEERPGGNIENNIKRHDPDLFLIDLIMPEHDGIEYMREIRHRLGDTPIIIYSCSLTSDFASSLKLLGATDVISVNDPSHIQHLVERAYTIVAKAA